MLVELEDALFAHLRQILDPYNVEVILFDEDVGEFDIATMSARVALGWRRVRLQPAEEVDPLRRDVRQLAQFEYRIEFAFVDLITSRPYKQTIDAVLLGFMGFTPRLADSLLKPHPCEVQQAGFGGQGDGVWSYSMDLIVPVDVYSDVANTNSDQVPEPFDWSGLDVGLRRSKINDLDTNVLDQVLNYQVE